MTADKESAVNLQDPDAEEGVGYRRPPRHSRFKPGQSGNRKGRPKGAKGRKTIVRRVAGERHWIVEHGERRRRSTVELVLLVLRNRAAEGHVAAFRDVSDLLARFGPQDAPEGGGYIVVPERVSMEEFEKESLEHAERMRQLMYADSEDPK